MAKVATLQRGKFTHRPRNEPKFYGGEYPFIQTGNIVRASKTGGKIQYSQTLNELGLKVSRLFEPRIILITIAANIGDTAILDYPACFPDSVVSIKPNSEDLDVDYLNIYIKYVKTYLINLAPQAAQKNINLQQLSPTPVVIPPLEKQQEIVTLFQNAYKQKQEKEAEAKRLLESIDAYLLEKLGIELPTQKETKKIFFTSLKEIQGKRFDPFYHKTEFEELENALQNGKYEVGKLGKFLSQISYGASVKNEYVKDSNIGIPFLRISDLKRNEISVKKIVYLSKSMEGKLGNCFVYENDFLISRSGTTGVVAKVDKSVQGFAYGSFMIKFVLKETALINKDYLSFYLNTEIMQKLIERDRIGAIQGNITISTIRNFIIPLPPLEVQDEIASYISDLRNRAKELEKEAKVILKSAKKEVENMILGE